MLKEVTVQGPKSSVEDWNNWGMLQEVTVQDPKSSTEDWSDLGILQKKKKNPCAGKKILHTVVLLVPLIVQHMQNAVYVQLSY